MEVAQTGQPISGERSEVKKFGTLEGVFLPNILTILGVIMYLRQGVVMGESGLYYGVGIILLAHLVTVTTGLSLSAVATNMHVKAGGAYYIISRSLGIEWGACIGIPFAISQTLSIALYTLGFAEALRMLSTVPSLSYVALVADYPLWLLGLTALGAMTLLSFRGSDVVIKTQYVVLACVIGSLVALFAGKGLTQSGYKPPAVGAFENLDFWEAFAIFFPAVTGIMAGVSLSGNLKKPERAIPRGTMGSVFVGLAVYLGVGLFLSFNASPADLASDTEVMLKIAWRPEPVLFGIWAATLSSGLGCILAAPRTIQALAKDRILPSFLARTHGRKQEPLMAMCMALLIAAAAILFGKLDLVAPVLSMFFLATYGMLNLIAGLERLVDNPSYRPTIKVPWWVSIFGALCCFYVMFLINTPATVIAVVMIFVIYVLIKRQKIQATWGDLRRGFWLSLIRRSLLQVELLPEHPKNWRPNVMVVTGIPQGRLYLIELADWLGSRRGLVTLHHVLVGPYKKMLRRKQMAFNNLIRFIRENGLNALPAVDVVEDRTLDLRKIVTSQGFGSFQPNTVMLDWDERTELDASGFAKLCEGVIMADKVLLILRIDRDRKFGQKRRIDVWTPLNFVHLPMLLIMSYLISQDEDWKGSCINVQAVAGGEGGDENRLKTEQTLRESRIPMEITFHEDMEKKDLYEYTDLVARRSIDSDLLIGPLPYSGTDPEELRDTLDRLAERMRLFSSIILVKGQAQIDLKE